VALHVLTETLALAHPVIPFVTEEIWRHVPGPGGLLMVRPFPAPDPALVDEQAEAQAGAAIAAIQELRGWRDRVGAPAGAALPARLEAPDLERTADAIARLARLRWSENGGEPVAAVGVPGGTVAMLASAAVDPEAEARRAQERLAHLRAEVARAEGKLANRGFVDKAPAPVVQAERDKLARLREELEGLQA
jgi:valyl-tRNA synthetase